MISKFFLSIIDIDSLQTVYQLLKGRQQNNSTPLDIKTAKDVFEKYWKEVEVIEDMTNFNLKQFNEGFVKSLNTPEIDLATNIEELGFEFDGSWEMISYLVRMFLIGEDNFKWSTNHIGTFFVRAMNLFQRNEKYCGVLKNELYALIDETFTMPGEEINLSDMVHLHNVLDFNELIRKSLQQEYYRPPSNINMKSSFLECVNYVYNTSIEVHKFESKFYDDADKDGHLYKEKSICMNSDIHPECNKYCEWHKRFMLTIPRRDLLERMKFGLPQRKYALDNINDDLEMAKKLFPGQNLKNETQAMASTSTIVFCHQKRPGYEGDAFGQFAKTCSSFFHTPSDAGMVLTKNLDIQMVIKEDSDYKNVFEAFERSPTEFIKGGTLWSETTLVIDTDSGFNLLGQSYPKTPEMGPKSVQLQIHQPKEFANFIPETNHGHLTTPLTLEFGNEYFIDVFPNGQISSDDFKTLNYNQRKCKLESEVDASGVFNTYTQMNCKYQCRVELASQKCECVPWDYLHTLDSEECDVFGRACFFNLMKEITQADIDDCQYCPKECDYFKYEKHVTESKSILVGEDRYFKRVPHPVEYYRFNTGNEAFVEFLGDVNGTIVDKGLQNAYSNFYQDFDENYALDKYAGFIVVHLNFKEPKVMIISPKYSVFDMIGNFGGQFGLFEQITGASFLGILNLIILLIKLICPTGRNA